MTDDQATPSFRFARDVSAVAPKVGHDLATASFQLGGESFVLHVVEGPGADAVGFLGFATDFERTRLLRFGLHGSLIERLNDLPRSGHLPTVTHRYRPAGESQAADVTLERATAVFSTLRAPNGVDADAAIVAYDLAGGERVSAAITGYQRGWYWDLLLVAVGLAIWAIIAIRRAGEGIEVAVAQEAGTSLFEVAGAVTFRESLIG